MVGHNAHFLHAYHFACCFIYSFHFAISPLSLLVPPSLPILPPPTPFLLSSIINGLLSLDLDRLEEIKLQYLVCLNISICGA